MSEAFELDPPPPEIQAALESPPYPPAEEKFVRFYSRSKRNAAKSKEEGRPIFDSAEYVEIYTAGDKDNVVDRPVRTLDKYLWSEKYTAFRNGKSQDTGTPLAAWGGVTPERIEEFAYFKVKTVEQLAAIPDSALPKFGPGARVEREKAKTYLDALAGNSAVLELKSENEALKARLDALEKLAAQSAPAESKPKGKAKVVPE